MSEIKNGKVVASGEAIKSGKVNSNDREKYRQLAVSTGNVLSIPESLKTHFKENGLSYKWVSKRRIAKNGGYHPSNWIPYEFTPEQLGQLPRQFTEGVISKYLERQDLILAVKPSELQDEHRKNIQRKTAQQLDAFYQEVDADGNTILERSE